MEGAFIDNQALSLDRTIEDGCRVADSGCLRYLSPDDQHCITFVEVAPGLYHVVLSERTANMWRTLDEFEARIVAVAAFVRWNQFFDRAHGVWLAY